MTTRYQQVKIWEADKLGKQGWRVVPGTVHTSAGFHHVLMELEEDVSMTFMPKVSVKPAVESILDAIAQLLQRTPGVYAAEIHDDEDDHSGDGEIIVLYVNDTDSVWNIRVEGPFG